ncbi:hypothetical protein HJFPF1_09282 [Paramyrothecium foliicola]|nr:hypothetical protein HJFPF1_09282 [Paramyrothecium foliicola]
MGSDSSKVSLDRAPTQVRLPININLYYKSSWALKLQLGEHKDAPLYCADLPGGWYGDVILYNGPDTDSPPLAKGRQSGMGNTTKITLPPLGPGYPPLEEDLRSTASMTAQKYAFAIPTGPQGYPQQFEWRTTHGEEIRQLGESSHGWKLVWLNRNGPEEIVALWAGASIHRHMSLSKAAAFKFVNRGATGEFGDAWALMTVFTFIRLWQKKMQTTMTNGAATAGTANVVAAVS